VWLVTGLPKAIQLAALSPNGKRLLVYTRDKGYLLYDMDTNKLVAELDDVDGEPRFQFSPNGHRLLTWGARQQYEAGGTGAGQEGQPPDKALEADRVRALQ
jgi:hypothetical protein